jgi:hypothetical protein
MNNQTRITRIFMPSFSLQGWVPGELGELNQLEQLVLRNNSLRDRLPLELSRLRRLEFLELQFNNIVGEIPPEWEGMASIRDLMLNDNNLTGLVPPGFSNLRNLTQFFVQNNMLRGEMIVSTVPNSTYRFAPQRLEPPPPPPPSTFTVSPILIPAILSSVAAVIILGLAIYAFIRHRNQKPEPEHTPSVNDTDTDYSDNEEHVYAHDVETGEVHEFDAVNSEKQLSSQQETASDVVLGTPIVVANHTGKGE